MSVPRANRRDPVLEHCRRILAGGSRTFTLASYALDPVAREGACYLYAWARTCDDRIDGQSLGHDQRGFAGSSAAQSAALAELRDATDRALAGEPPRDPVFAGIARVVSRHGIPRDEPFELLEGMAMDIEGRRYATLPELARYSHRVAGIVALMMARVLGVRDQVWLDRAADLGIAMQYTNVARDVMDDARIGRVYLPLDWLREVGIDPAAIGSVGSRRALVTVVGRLLDAADGLYTAADHRFPGLRRRSLLAVYAARRIYAEIGHEIRRRGERAWDRRTVVPRPRQLGLFLAALLRTVAPGGLA